MPAKKQAAPRKRAAPKPTPASEPADEASDFDPDGVTLSQWEFINRIPTAEDVLDLLAGLPTVYGVSPADFVDFVIGLPSKKKRKIREPGPGGNERERVVYDDIVNLYMSVAGRLTMLREICKHNGWSASFQPEPHPADGLPPGFLVLDSRIVYREYLEIWATGTDGQMLSFGRRSGTAWVPATEGQQAAGTNPWEKVETSARGRAMAAWGIGVLPGSGIASLEEMQGRTPAIPGGPESDAATKTSREDLLEALLLEMEQVRQLRGIETTEMRQRVADYAADALQVDIAIRDDAGELVNIDLDRLKTGQLSVTLNQMQATRRKLDDERSNV